MLETKLIDHLKSKGWWFDDYSQEYMDSLADIKVDINSDFAQFYLHAEDGPTFYSRNKEIYQLCWFIINSDYREQLINMRNVLSLSESYFMLDSFEGESGYFYNADDESVILLELGKIDDGKSYDIISKWRDFNDFLIWYFNIN